MIGVPFLEKAISGWLRPHSLDDPVDRLNYFVTTAMLAFFGIMVSAKQYVGSPIQCWTPKEFSDGWDQYVEDYCFIQNTYYVDTEGEIPTDLDQRKEAQIGYYQWVPIVFALQALMFYAPTWAWKMMHRQSGVDVESAVTDARALSKMNGMEREDEVHRQANHLFDILEMGGGKRQKIYSFWCFQFGNQLGSYVSSLYLLIKAANVANLLLQLFLLDRFLGHDDVLWGFKVAAGLFAGTEWHESGLFPRVTLCDFSVRVVGQIQRRTVQCVLMINMFNEKIYLFLWFWFLLVLSATAVNFLYCVCQTIFPRARIYSCRTWLSTLKSCNGFSRKDAEMIARFAIYGLQPDGILLLRFVEGHSGGRAARELAVALYMKFLKEARPPRPSLSSTSSYDDVTDEKAKMTEC